MNLKHYCLILIACTISIFGKSTVLNEYKPANAVICPTKKTCINKKDCKCWCSHLCGPREKEEDDSPVYVNDDPYGNYCYCKQWDLDNVGRCQIKAKKK